MRTVRHIGMLLLFVPMAAFAGTKPVPQSCDASVNRGLVQFIADNQGAARSVDQDNVMVCGIMERNSFSQRPGAHGGHQVLVIKAPAANGGINVAVITNDNLDGVVTAAEGDTVFAYGQAYLDPGPMTERGTQIAAGVHEPHCATHRGADDGWVVVNGVKYPRYGCPAGR